MGKCGAWVLLRGHAGFGWVDPHFHETHMKQLGVRDSPPVLAPPTLHLDAFSSASIFSSQYVIPIYIVVAVVRCSCACSRLPVRR